MSLTIYFVSHQAHQAPDNVTTAIDKALAYSWSFLIIRLNYLTAMRIINCSWNLIFRITIHCTFISSEEEICLISYTYELESELLFTFPTRLWCKHQIFNIYFTFLLDFNFVLSYLMGLSKHCYKFEMKLFWQRKIFFLKLNIWKFSIKKRKHIMTMQ